MGADLISSPAELPLRAVLRSQAVVDIKHASRKVRQPRPLRNRRAVARKLKHAFRRLEFSRRAVPP